MGTICQPDAFVVPSKTHGSFMKPEAMNVWMIFTRFWWACCDKEQVMVLREQDREVRRAYANIPHHTLLRHLFSLTLLPVLRPFLFVILLYISPFPRFFFVIIVHVSSFPRWRFSFVILALGPIEYSRIDKTKIVELNTGTNSVYWM